MHTEMWEHPAVQENLATLRRRGVHVLEPESGRLAGGDVGAGRLADPERIAAAALALLDPGHSVDWPASRVLVTAGGTREPIDAVRVISNRSSGKQGYAVAEAAAARRRHASPSSPPSSGRSRPASRRSCGSRPQPRCRRPSWRGPPSQDVIVMAAAVADFRPKAPSDTKTKKEDGPPEIVLEPTHDFLVDLGAHKPPGQVLVGFAAETEDLVAHAADKLRRKRLDLIVGNDVGRPDAGFEVDTNRAVAARRRRRGAGVAADVESGARRGHLRPDRPSALVRTRSRVLRFAAGFGRLTRPSRVTQFPGTTPTVTGRSRMPKHTFTSESVTEGHPDKMADQISDTMLDAVLQEDPYGRVACETMVTTGLCVVAGEISTKAHIDFSRLARDTICEIGYTDAAFGIDGKTCGVIVSIDEQSPDIAMGVDKALEQREGTGDNYDEVGAGDQGMMFGYACDETDALMPMPIWLAHKMAARLTDVRKQGIVDILRPDGKTQVSIDYEDGVPKRLRTVLISTQHHAGISIDDDLRPALIEHVIRPSLPEQFAGDDFEIFVNPTGQFELGGPHADCGLTGRKIIVDTYGGMARHGGGAFSGKDPTKVDRSAAYAVRQIAKTVVAAGLAKRCEAQVAYAIGVAHPVSIMIDTFGTGEVGRRQARGRGARSVRHAPRRDHRAARPAPPDLPAHRRVRPLRPDRR